MTGKLRKFVPALAAALMLAVCACSVLAPPSASLERTTLDFAERLRWKDLREASAFLDQAQREDFLARFGEGDDLRMVEVRVERVDLREEEKATVYLLVEYYRLPSPTVRKLKIDQEWEYRRSRPNLPGTWVAVSPFPAIP